MRLVSLRLENVGPFDATTVRFADADPEAVEAGEATPAPRPVTVLFGADGIGKTTLLSALAVTRPGYAIPPPPTPALRAARPGGAEAPPLVKTEWLLGDDDPERPHPLVVTSPNALLPGETAESAIPRRREQALFERRAQSEGGFVFVGFSGARWFSRNTNMLSTPERSLLKYDVRQPVSFDDPTRADLTRETKQVLSYAAIARALGAGRTESADVVRAARVTTYEQLARFDAALREVVDVVLEPFGFAYAGTSPVTLEPEVYDRAHGSRVVVFDALPRPTRHLVAFGALTLRALFAAYPSSEAPRESEGVAAIDDIESQQDPAMLREIVPLLTRALPNVQWILTTASTQLALACTKGEVVALRKTEERIEVGEGLLH